MTASFTNRSAPLARFRAIYFAAVPRAFDGARNIHGAVLLRGMDPRNGKNA